MGISIALGLSRFAPIDNPATVTGHEPVLLAIIVILGLLLVLLLIGMGVSLAQRPDRRIDEFGEPTSTPPPGPPR